MLIIPALPGQIHDRYDFAAATRIFTQIEAAQPLQGHSVTSPWHLHAIERLRDQHGLRKGPTTSSDLFIWAKGEARHPAATKMGGRPYWPKGRPWPQDENGNALFFLAQINFRDSMDLIGRKLPGDLLVITSREEIDFSWSDDDVSWHWVSTDDEPDLDLEVDSAIGDRGPIHGLIHRIQDYPEADDSQLYDVVKEHWHLPVIHGTKIGGRAHSIQGDNQERDEILLCQLSSIELALDVPYPFANEAASRHFDLQSLFDNRPTSPMEMLNSQALFAQFLSGRGCNNQISFSDMGSLYFFLNSKNEVALDFQGY
ncbi:MAG: hypothetical protein RL095_3368 [Verrucomicrobiota bacterium]|jgi:hypothetical protein